MTPDTRCVAAIEGIRSAAERMRSNSKFKVVFDEIPPLAAADIDAWQEWLREQPGMKGYLIPAQLRELYAATGGFRLRWQYLPTKKPTTGSAELLDLTSLYQADDEKSKPINQIYDEPRPFDIIDQQTLVAIRFSRNGSLSLVRIDRDSHTEQALELKPTEYVHFAATFLARYGWQERFMTGSGSTPAERDALAREVRALLEK